MQCFNSIFVHENSTNQSYLRNRFLDAIWSMTVFRILQIIENSCIVTNMKAFANFRKSINVKNMQALIWKVAQNWTRWSSGWPHTIMGFLNFTDICHRISHYQLVTKFTFRFFWILQIVLLVFLPFLPLQRGNGKVSRFYRICKVWRWQERSDAKYSCFYEMLAACILYHISL